MQIIWHIIIVNQEVNIVCVWERRRKAVGTGSKKINKNKNKNKIIITTTAHNIEQRQ